MADYSEAKRRYDALAANERRRPPPSSPPTTQLEGRVTIVHPTRPSCEMCGTVADRVARFGVRACNHTVCYPCVGQLLLAFDKEASHESDLRLAPMGVLKG